MGDGTVNYSGYKYVRVRGAHKIKISAESVRELTALFSAKQFFKLEDEYFTKKNPDGTVTIATDLPTTTLSLKIDGKIKKVSDYFGTPADVIELEGAVDRTAGTQRWIFVDVDVIRSWAKRGWDARKNGAEYLVGAAQWRDFGLSQTLLALGAPPNVPDKNGELAVVYAAAFGDGKLIKLLLTHGADVNRRDRNGGRTALITAAREANVSTVVQLLSSGADVDKSDSQGWTAFMHATCRGRLDVMEQLLAAGADAGHKDKDGETVRSWLAQQHAEKPANLDEINRVLLQAEQKH